MKKFIFALFALLSLINFTACPGFYDGDDSENHAKGLSLTAEKNDDGEITLTLDGVPKFSKQFDISQLKKCSVRFSILNDSSTGSSSPVDIDSFSSSNTTFIADKIYYSDEKNNVILGTFAPKDSKINESLKVKISAKGTYKAKCELNFLNNNEYYNSTLYSEEFTVE